jgi:Mce-associated membrane protein
VTDGNTSVTEGSSDPDSSRSSTGRHRRVAASPRLPVAVLVTLLLCLPVAAVAIVFVVQTPSGSSSSSSLLAPNREAALSAARSSVRTILSYDYRTIDADIAKAKADTTGVFSGQYASTAHQLLSEASQVKAIVQATVGSAGVVSADGNNVVILLFVDQASVRKTPGKATPTTRIDQSRVRVTMTMVNGRWLVSALAAL